MSRDKDAAANRVQLLMIKGVISELPQEQQDKINAIATTFRNVIAANGDLGAVALALVGAELAAE